MTGSAQHISESTEVVGDELQPGTTLCFGQYKIVQYLNSGGFGITYLALDSLGRKIVIKECFPGAMCRRSDRQVSLRSPSYLVDFERVVELFEREARALAQLSHPNIVGVHQIFKDNGTAYMALDFVEGRDLLQVIEDSPSQLGPFEVKRIVLSLLNALSYVHQNGILHRDISPDNILLGSDGSPVLIDFGAARENAARTSRILSRVQTVKDGYSPQEFYLADGSQEVPSDLDALAATIHHVITGAPPPNSTLRLSAVAESRNDPYTPLLGRVRGYDRHFLGAVDKCLSVFGKDRLTSAEAWLDQIDESRRQKSLLDKAQNDEEIERKISQLISESQAAPPPRAVEQKPKRVTSRLREDPEEREKKLAAEREYWAILNEPPEPEVDAPPTQRATAGTAPILALDIAPAAEIPDDPAEPDPVIAARASRVLRLKRRISLFVIIWSVIMFRPFAAFSDQLQADLPFVSTHHLEATQ